MDKEKVLEQLAKAWGAFPQQDNELSARNIFDAIELAGGTISMGHVQKNMKKLMEEGWLSGRRINAHASGGKMHVYSPAEGKTWEDVLQYIKEK